MQSLIYWKGNALAKALSESLSLLIKGDPCDRNKPAHTERRNLDSAECTYGAKRCWALVRFIENQSPGSNPDSSSSSVLDSGTAVNSTSPSRTAHALDR